MGPRKSGAAAPRTAEDILGAFVVRARRIAAHSLAQDKEVLRRQASQWTMTVDGDGHLWITQHLPDEERFESLAARIRPLTLAREPIWYRAVLDALGESLKSRALDAQLASELEAVTGAWSTWDTENLAMRGYYTQLSRSHGGGEESHEVFQATDSQLGAGWFYADVAHADPKGGKAVALEYSLNDRYAAAVSTYSGLTLVVLRTLELVQRLSECGHLTLPESVWATPVTADSGEVRREGAEAFVGPAGTTIPPLGSNLGPEWEAVTVKTIERSLGMFRGNARFVATDGSEIWALPATTRWRHENGQRVGVDLTLDGRAVIHLPGPDVPHGEFALEFTNPGSNRSLLNGLRAQQAIFAAREMSVQDEFGAELLRVALGDSGELPIDQQVALEACTDLVGIEELTGVQFGLLTHLPSPTELTRRRVLRLLLEGKVTRAMPRLLDLDHIIEQTSAPIRFEPHGEIVEAETVAVPALHVWHSDMKVERISAAGAMRPIYRVTVPASERFLVWAPDLQPRGFDHRHATPVAWGLRHLVSPHHEPGSMQEHRHP